MIIEESFRIEYFFSEIDEKIAIQLLIEMCNATVL